MENDLNEIANFYETTSKIHALTKVDRTKIEFVWRIENFSFCSKKYEILESSTFSSNKLNDCFKWNIRLYSNGVNDENKNFIGLFLVLTQDKSFNKKKPKVVIYSFCIINSNDHKVNLVRSIPDGREFLETDSWGFPKFLNKDLLESDFNNLVPKDQLTIVLEMCVFGDIFTLNELDIKKNNLKLITNEDSEEKKLIKNHDNSKKYQALKQNEINLEKNEKIVLEKGFILENKKENFLEIKGFSNKNKNEVSNNRKENNLESNKILEKKNDLENKKVSEIKKENDLEKKKENNLEKKNKLKLEKRIFSDYFLNSKFSDLVLISCDGKEIPVHKVILANESKVFCHKFENLKTENKNLKFEIRNFDYQTIIDVLSFIYKGNLNFISTMEKIISFSDFYCILDLKSYCEKEMIDKLSVQNVLNYLIVSEKCNLVNLKNCAFNFLKNNTEKFFYTDEWKNILIAYPGLIKEIYDQILKSKKIN